MIMNKKYSTLMAVFLAAGATFTAEAGVVKVTKPVVGKQYVIADGGWAVGTQKAVLTSNDGATGVIGIVGDATKFSTLPMWTVDKTNSGIVIKIADGKYLNSESGTITLTAKTASEDNQKITYAEGAPSIKIGAE